MGFGFGFVVGLFVTSSMVHNSGSVKRGYSYV